MRQIVPLFVCVNVNQSPSAAHVDAVSNTNEKLWAAQDRAKEWKGEESGRSGLNVCVCLQAVRVLLPWLRLMASESVRVSLFTGPHARAVWRAESWLPCHTISNIDCCCWAGVSESGATEEILLSISRLNTRATAAETITKSLFFWVSCSLAAKEKRERERNLPAIFHRMNGPAACYFGAECWVICVCDFKRLRDNNGSERTNNEMKYCWRFPARPARSHTDTEEINNIMISCAVNFFISHFHLKDRLYVDLSSLGLWILVFAIQVLQFCTMSRR